MSGRKREKNNTGFLMVVTITAVLASVILLAFMVFTGTGVNSNPVTQKVNREVTKKAVEKGLFSQITGVGSVKSIDEVWKALKSA